MGKDWKEIRELVGEYAAENLNNGLNCAESVFDACIRSGALDTSLDAVSYMSGFGGGVGCSGFTCGALSAAVLANGMVHGRKNPGAIPAEERGNELRDRVYKRYNNISSEFIKVSGSGLCREIVDNFSGYFDPETRKNCIRICRAAAQIAVDFLQKSEEDVKDLEYDMSVIGIKGWRASDPPEE